LENKLKKNRFLIKLSGEVIKGDKEAGISLESIDNLSKRLISIIKKGIQLGIVIGGGNIFRGSSGNLKNYNRVIGDQIGMMATVINALSLYERIQAYGIPVLLQSGIKIDGVADLFNKDRVEEIFKRKGVVIFCCGIGNPYFSTDTTAVLRALQIEAEWVFKATKVDGIYDKDPVKYTDALFYNSITFDEILEKKLGIMDLSSIILMKENNIKLRVFNIFKNNTLEKVCSGEKTGTIVVK
jgi:uridylate kinase